jgi:hypothetical protein
MAQITNTPSGVAVTTAWNGSSFDTTLSHGVVQGDQLLTIIIASQWIDAPAVTIDGAAVTPSDTLNDGNGSSLHVYEVLSPAVGARSLNINTGGIERPLAVIVYNVAEIDISAHRLPGASISTLSGSTASATFSASTNDLLIDAIVHQDTSVSSANAGQTLHMDDVVAGSTGYVASSSSRAITSTSGTETIGWSLDVPAAGIYFAVGYKSAVAAPATLSAPTSTNVTLSTVTVGASTDQTSGVGTNTGYVVFDVTANMSGIGSAQIIAGDNANDVAAVGSNNITISASPFTDAFTGLSLTAGTEYTYAWVQTNDNGTSNVLTGTFTTPAANPMIRLNLVDKSGSAVASETGITAVVSTSANLSTPIVDVTNEETDASGVIEIPNGSLTVGDTYHLRLFKAGVDIENDIAQTGRVKAVDGNDSNARSDVN